MEIAKTKVNQVVIPYKQFSGKHATVEVSEWGNCEGFTLCVDTNGVQCLSITHYDWSAIQLAMNALDVHEPKEESN